MKVPMEALGRGGEARRLGIASSSPSQGAAGLLHKLSLDPKVIVAGQGKETQKKVLAAPNGSPNGVVTSSKPLGGVRNHGQQDYKNASMYASTEAYRLAGLFSVCGP
ncbi:uncharacterized protein [Triticum aestivum]|uniref:uncharacterized protein n=1 Tax=Triticum aestivum TaxID=4565 RepID=UPI001D009869|nr:uncharacterized protein LOC123124701 [Triticum aestivum]